VKIAFIADIHGNLPALQAVFQNMPVVDLCVCTGDLVGYYPDVNEVCNFVRNYGIVTVRGNHDAYVLGALEPAAEKATAYRSFWTRDQLSTENKRWLATLPVELAFRCEAYKISLRHASPWDESTYLYQDSEELRKISLKQFELLVLGHTHHPMQIDRGKGFIVNPGSVGQPRDWNPKASYLLFDTKSSQFEFRRVAYDVERLQKRLENLDWDDTMIKILSRKKNKL